MTALEPIPQDGRGVESPGAAAALTAFVLAFPAFIVYQVLTQGGTIPPVLGGFGTAGAVVALPLAVVALFRQSGVTGLSPSPAGALFATYLALFAVVVFSGDSAQVDRTVTGPHVAYLFKFVVWYLIARTIDLDHPTTRRTLSAILVAVIALVLGTALARRSILPVLHPLVEGLPPGDYHGAAMIFVAMGVFVIPSRRLAARLPLYALSIVTLFLIGARSEFVGFLFAAAVIEFCKARSRFLATLGLAGGAALALGLVQSLARTADGNRIFGLLALARDESARLRAEMAQSAWVTVWEHPVLGAYASYPPGEYAHNLVSAWVDFGIVGFFLLVCLVALPLVGLATTAAEDSRRDDFTRVLAIASVVALLMLVAKTHTYQLLAVSLGLYSRYRLTRRLASGGG